ERWAPPAPSRSPTPRGSRMPVRGARRRTGAGPRNRPAAGGATVASLDRKASLRPPVFGAMPTMPWEYLGIGQSEATSWPCYCVRYKWETVALNKFVDRPGRADGVSEGDEHDASGLRLRLPQQPQPDDRQILGLAGLQDHRYVERL